MTIIHRIILLFCVVLISISILNNNSYAQVTKEETETEAFITKTKKGVIRVTVDKGLDNVEVGAGIMIGEQFGNIYFLTAYHVIEDYQEILIENYGERGKKFKATVYDDRYDPPNDIAVLVVPSYLMSKNSVEQLYEKDIEKLIEDTVWLLGHPADTEWDLSWTTIYSKSSSRLLLQKDIVKPSHSGGAVLDRSGNLVGMILAEKEDGYGEAVRIDVAFDVIDKWAVPYKVYKRVDFCEIIQHLTEIYLLDFDELKGYSYEIHGKPYWELLNKSMDITGQNQTALLKSPLINNEIAYYAYFGRQRNEYEAKKLMNQIAQQVSDCIPKSRIFSDTDYCLYSQFRAKKNWLKDPLMLVTHRTIGNIVELIIYKGTDVPYGMNRGNEFALDFNMPWNRKR